jgi:acyl-CoA synthetase (NDP forming)
VVFVPPLVVPGAAYAMALREVVTGADAVAKPIVSTFLAVAGVPSELAVLDEDGAPGYGSVPSYSSPERAVLALALVRRYARWRDRPRGDFRRPDGIDVVAARAIVDRNMSDVDGEHRVLADGDSVALLGCYGIGVVDFRLVGGEAAALAAAGELGFPVAMKSTSQRLRHSVDLVGVRLDLGSADAVRSAYRDLLAVSGSGEMIVQRMVPRGTSCVVGLQDDPSFGSLVSFGLSGIVSDLLGDRAYRAVPLTDADADELITEPRAAPLLSGYGGGEPVDTAALAELVLRVNAIAEDLPEVRALVLDPVLAAPSGASVSSASIVLGPPPSHADAGPRRLR